MCCFPSLFTSFRDLVFAASAASIEVSVIARQEDKVPNDDKRKAECFVEILFLEWRTVLNVDRNENVLLLRQI